MKKFPISVPDAAKQHACDDAVIVRDVLLRVSAGDYSVRIADPVRPSELGGLAAAFNCMAEKLDADILRLTRDYQTMAVSESRYRELVEKANCIILKWDVNGKMIYLNTFAEHFFGFTSAEIIGQNIIGTIVPETESSGRDLIELMQNICHDPESYMNNSNENSCKDGRRVWVSWNNHAITGSDGVVEGILSVGQDITERIEAQDQLRKSEQRFRSFVENINDVLFALNPSGEFSYVSPQWKHAFGYEVSETIGQSFIPFVHPDDVSGCLAFVDKVIKTGQRQSGIEYRVLCKDGHYLWYTANASLFADPGDGTPMLVGIGRDITERKLLQREILKVQKLESVTALASGIAHNFNNVMTGIIGYISFAKKHLKNPEKVLPLLEFAEKASYSASKLARQLLQSTKRGTPAKIPIQINELLQESASLFLTGTPISYTINCQSHQVIYADAEQVSQAFNNIVINAAQAMPEGGTLAVTVRSEELPAVSRYMLPAGNYVEIVFVDSGCGIRSENLHKVFDPYFTTKDGGTGLGLSTTFSVINNHGGHIEITSEIGQGTTVKIILPTSAENPVDAE